MSKLYLPTPALPPPYSSPPRSEFTGPMPSTSVEQPQAQQTAAAPRHPDPLQVARLQRQRLLPPSQCAPPLDALRHQQLHSAQSPPQNQLASPYNQATPSSWHSDPQTSALRELPSPPGDDLTASPSVLGKRKRMRITACQNCHTSKKKCSTGLPCDYCKRTGRVCIYPDTKPGTYQTGKKPTPKVQKRQESVIRHQNERFRQEHRLPLMQQMAQPLHPMPAPVPVISNVDQGPIVINDTPPQSPRPIDADSTNNQPSPLLSDVSDDAGELSFEEFEQPLTPGSIPLGDQALDFFGEDEDEIRAILASVVPSHGPTDAELRAKDLEWFESHSQRAELEADTERWIRNTLGETL